MAKIHPIFEGKDVLGRPGLPRKERVEKGATLDMGHDVSDTRLATLVAQADAGFNTIIEAGSQQDREGINGMRKMAQVDVIKMIEQGVPSGKLPVSIQQLIPQQVEAPAWAGKFGDWAKGAGMDADLVKEITTGMTSGGSGTAISGWSTNTGPWLYDLEVPAKEFYPVRTPFRNMIPRTKGVGTAKLFRTITGITGSKTGGVADQRISIDEGTTASFRGLTLNRPGKINWATGTGSVFYRMQGFSDDLTWAADLASQGFENLRGLISANLLKAHFMGEEKLILHGRQLNTSVGGTGALAAPTAAPTLTQRAPANSEVALSGYTTNVYVKVTTYGYFGESAGSSVANVAVTAGDVIDVTCGTLPVGALGFRVYVSTGASDPGDASRFKQVWNSGPMQGRDYSGGNLFTLSGALAVAGTVMPTVDTGTASYDDYDGIFSQVAVNGGVSLRANATLTLSMLNGQVLLPLFENLAADPELLAMNSVESLLITNLVLGTSGTPYHVVVSTDQEGNLLGNYRVSRMMNKITGSLLDILVHRDIPQGNVLAYSKTLPLPNTNVPNVWEISGPRDYMSVDWPDIQMSHDSSTFAMTALVGYAPAYNAVLQGLQAPVTV